MQLRPCPAPRKGKQPSPRCCAHHNPPLASVLGSSLPFSLGLLLPTSLSAGCRQLGDVAAGPASAALSAPTSSRESQPHAIRNGQQYRPSRGSSDLTSWLLTFCRAFFGIWLLCWLLGLCCCDHRRLFLPLLAGRNLFWFVRIPLRYFCCCLALNNPLLSPYKGRKLPHRGSVACWLRPSKT